MQKRRMGALWSRQEQVANEILMYFRAQRKNQGELSLSDSIDGDGDGSSLSLMDTISVDDNMLEELDARESCVKVRRCVRDCLDPRETMVITLRYGLNGRTPMTQREIAAQCGISRSYVSRIEKKALKKLETAMEGRT
ncbi:sigma-70 family RNA polymerase sigma factor [Intestinimonas massiliensis (ex Afouda et al. 2020)]|uniref:sigma-70 family RNA polymerase sigma factor n=1 Tax=Intestinimonas massiliensis (ex Afouda et al. 2020) TaxID=1673721 RepID=UPI001F5EAD85|nr:sigma-70 family RNA polymerase sigma factor [Intestinimonas massiliensis (ex Afouda et al. 2020)]